MRIWLFDKHLKTNTVVSQQALERARNWKYLSHHLSKWCGDKVTEQRRRWQNWCFMGLQLNSSEFSLWCTFAPSLFHCVSVLEGFKYPSRDESHGEDTAKETRVKQSISSFLRSVLVKIYAPGRSLCPSHVKMPRILSYWGVLLGQFWAVADLSWHEQI